jgi:hypothetical protein
LIATARVSVSRVATEKQESLMDGKVVLVFISLLMIGGGYIYYRHQMHVENYEPESICAHRLTNSFYIWSAFWAVEIPKGSDQASRDEATRKYAARMANAQNADRDEFVGIVMTVVSAQRMKIAKENMICLPPDVKARVYDVYHDYTGDIDARLERNSALCRSNYEDDVIGFLMRKYRCLDSR